MKPFLILSQVLLIALATAGSASAGLGEAEFLEHYKAGLDAIEAEDWPRAAELMRRAISRRGEESRRLPKYVYLKPYLPHFYLGLADFKQGNCQAALTSWRLSELYGIVQKRPQYAQIELARELCQREAPPATQAPSQASTTAAAPPPPPVQQPERTVAPPPSPAPKSRPAQRPAAPRAPPAAPTPVTAGGYELAPERHALPDGPPTTVLLDAATALLDGSYQQVIDRLSAETPADVYAQGHAHLLLAAAELALYLTSGERETDRLETARRHVLEVRSILPDLEPPERYFSPRFLDFFYGQRIQEER